MQKRTLTIRPKAPFRLELTAWALRRRPENEMDRWDGVVYHRAFRWGDDVRELQVTQVSSTERSPLQVQIRGDHLSPRDDQMARRVLERMLGVRADLHPFYRLAARHPQLNELVQRYRGMKPPRFPTIFEGLLNGIACQQVSLVAGIRLLNRLTRRFGSKLDSVESAFAFPAPEQLVRAQEDDLRELGFSYQKARAVLALSQAACDGTLDLEGLAEKSDEEALGRLQELRGIGRWTAEYVLLRGLGRHHIFPGDDIGARNYLQKWLGCRTPLDYGQVQRTLAKWQPFAGLLYFHFLLGRLEAAGFVQHEPPSGLSNA